jgi:hypothetical protein
MAAVMLHRGWTTAHCADTAAAAHAKRVTGAPTGVDELIAALRARADDDFHHPPADHEPGRHTVDVSELGLRVTLTRSRYPNRPGGVDLYALTISRIVVGLPPRDADVVRILRAGFGAAAAGAQPRPGGPAVRMFRLPAGD